MAHQLHQRKPAALINQLGDHLALALRESSEQVALADLDVVDPYFRSRECAPLLARRGIRLISSANTCRDADLPSMPAEVNVLLDNPTLTGVLDIGGDPIGARVLARFAHQLKSEDFDLLFVLNANRPETKDVESALQYMQGIEAECRQKVTGIVNNTHLCGETTAEEILKGARLAQQLSERTSLPVIHHAVQRKFVEQVQDKLSEPVLPMNIYMKKPWEIIFCEEE